MARYFQLVEEVDKLPQDDLNPVLYGLCGEVGGFLAIMKKEVREKDAAGYKEEQVKEELGDILWYLVCALIRLDRQEEFTFPIENPSPEKSREGLLKTLAREASNFLDIADVPPNRSKEIIHAFQNTYFSILLEHDLKFEDVLSGNKEKITGRFIKPNYEGLDTFDSDFPDYEQLPSEFEIEFMQRGQEKQAIRWNGVFLGAPLMDNSKDSDGYRFHDVFHLGVCYYLALVTDFQSFDKA